MLSDIFYISNVLNWITTTLALITGAIYCYRSNNPLYMRLFPVYLFISIGVEILANPLIHRLLHIDLFGRYEEYAMNTIYNLFTPCELLMFAYFLLQIIRSPFIKKAIIISLMLFFVFFIFFSSLEQEINSTAILLESVIIIIPCLAWYRELFSRPEPINLVREPSFWLVTAIFFYLATIIPSYLTNNYLISHGLINTAQNLHSINNFAVSIAYLLFIKGFTCRIRRS